MSDRICALAIIATAAVPFRFPLLDHSASVFDVALLLVFVPWILTVRRVGPPRIPLPYLWLGLGMVVLGALSLLWTASPAETLLYIVACVEGLLAFAMMATFLRDVRPASFMPFLQVWVILLVIPGMLLWFHVPGFLPPATLDPNTGDYVSYFVRFSHPFIGRSNNLAALLLLLVPPTVAWALRTRRWPDVAMAVVGELAFMLTISRGAFAALLAALGLYFVLERRGRRRTLLALAWSLPVAALAVVLGSLNPPTRMYFASRFSGANIDARIDLLQDAWNGDPGASGGGGLRLPTWLTGQGGGIGRDVHNTYIQQVLSFGPILGVLIAATLLITGIWWYRRSHLHLRATARIHGIGVIAVLASFVVESSFEGSLLRPLIWLGWGMLVVGALRPSVRTLPWSSVSFRRRASKPLEGAPR